MNERRNNRWTEIAFGVPLRMWGWLLLLPLMQGCGGGSFPVQTEVVPYTQEQELVRQEAQIAQYRFRAGDVIKVAFKYESSLDQDNVLVMPDGYISVEGLSRVVRARGLTVNELNQNLTTEYAKDIRSPELSVIVREITDPEVYVLGEVARPGLYKMPTNGVGVIQAVAMAGGFTDDANSSESAVLRATDEGFMLRSIDLSNLKVAGYQDMAYFDLQAYDVIYVPRSSVGGFAYYSQAIFGSALNITRFFWDIYALANIDKIDRIVR